MNKFLALVLIFNLFGCASPTRRSVARKPAADESELIAQFLKELAERTGQKQSAVERSFMTALSENADRISAPSNIRGEKIPISRDTSLDDLESLSERDQKRVITRVINMSDLSENLDLEDDDLFDVVVKTVEDQKNLRPVRTHAVPDLHKLAP